MEKILYSKFDKSKIGQLPRVLFPGRIFVIETEQDAADAVNYLLTQPVLGVDTETKPSFHKGHQHKVALLQVSTHDACFLFRLNKIGMCEPVVRLLSDTTVPKIGLSLHDDILMLHRLGDFKPGKFIDLQAHVAEFGIEDMSLQKLYANFFGQRISKRERLTNWEAPELKDGQKRYAATDAWTCINLYEVMVELKKSGNWKTLRPEPVEQTA